MRRSGDELRITSQLVDVSNGFQLWSDNYDRPLDDIFEIQDDIAEAVAMALSITLGVGEIGGLVGGTANPDAYNEYLLAQSLYREFSVESILAAIEHFKLAIEIDPGYALAWERLADIFVSSLYIPSLELQGRLAAAIGRGAGTCDEPRTHVPGHHRHDGIQAHSPQRVAGSSPRA